MTAYKNHKTNNPNVDVHITYTQHDPKVILRGYAIASDTGIKLDGAKTLKRTSSCDEDVPRAEFHLITAVMDSLRIKQPIVKRTSIAPGELDSENAMVQAFTALKNANDPIHAEWNGDTKDRRLHYFEHHILPHLQQYVTEEFLPSDLALLRQRLLDSILSSGKSKGIPQMAEKTADRNLSNAAVIYGRMRKCNPALPDIALAPLRRVKSVDHEPPKYIPEVVRQRCYRNLESQVDSAPIKVYGTVLMVDGALRTSESAGTLPCDITFAEDNAYVEVLWQEHEGKRIPRLKTDNAYRMVPLSYWGTTMIRRCIERIGTIPDEATSPLIRAQDLSAWILQMLRECGCDEEFFDQSIEEMYAHPDRNKDGTPNYDLAAYIWRRDRTERWRNICGLTCNPDGDSEIDYLLGHMTPHKRRKYDYRLPEKQAEIAKKLERYVYSSEISKHPAISPIEVVHGFDYILMPFDQTCICNTSETPLVIRCDFESSEPNEAITIIAPTNSMYGTPTVRHINTKEQRIARPIIGSNRSRNKEEE